MAIRISPASSLKSLARAERLPKLVTADTDNHDVEFRLIGVAQFTADQVNQLELHLFKNKAQFTSRHPIDKLAHGRLVAPPPCDDRQ